MAWISQNTSVGTPAVSSAGTTSAAPAFTTAPDDGDLLLAHLAVVAGVTVTAPAGWTECTNSPVTPAAGTTKIVCQVWYRFWSTGDPLTWTWTFGASTAVKLVLSAWRNVDAAVEDVAPVAAFTTSGGTSASATITTSTQRALLLGFASYGAGAGCAPPGTLTEVYDTTTNSRGAEAARLLTGAAGSSGALAWTFTAGTGVADSLLLVALRPANSAYTGAVATQQTAEVLVQPATTQPRVSQVALEALVQPATGTARARVSQLAVEVLVQPTAPAPAPGRSFVVISA